VINLKQPNVLERAVENNFAVTLEDVRPMYEGIDSSEEMCIP
jgi:hypothetical protein